MVIFLFAFLIPELVILLLTFYFGEKSWTVTSPFVLLLNFIPIGGSIITFKFKSMMKRKLPEFKDYMLVTGLSMISLFYNSTILLMWKLRTGFFWFIPVLAAEPIVALFYIKSLEES